MGTCPGSSGGSLILAGGGAAIAIRVGSLVFNEPLPRRGRGKRRSRDVFCALSRLRAGCSPVTAMPRCCRCSRRSSRNGRYGSGRCSSE